MADLSDEQLVERSRGGDEAAFAALVARHERQVFGLIGRLVADRQRMEDLAQEVFVRVYRGLPYFRGQARLGTWIYRIVANVCAEERGRRRPAVSLDETDESGRRLHEPGADDRAFRDLEFRDRLDKAMGQLSDRDRLLVAAHYLKGVQYEALAEAFDLPLGTVKTHLHRAKRQLRRILERA
jgi:RNA polymerase sigma-70 factor (ECF subfamily)